MPTMPMVSTDLRNTYSSAIGCTSAYILSTRFLRSKGVVERTGVGHDLEQRLQRRKTCWKLIFGGGKWKRTGWIVASPSPGNGRVSSGLEFRRQVSGKKSSL